MMHWERVSGEVFNAIKATAGVRSTRTAATLIVAARRELKPEEVGISKVLTSRLSKEKTIYWYGPDD